MKGQLNYEIVVNSNKAKKQLDVFKKAVGKVASEVIALNLALDKVRELEITLSMREIPYKRWYQFWK